MYIKLHVYSLLPHKYFIFMNRQSHLKVLRGLKIVYKIMTLLHPITFYFFFFYYLFIFFKYWKSSLT